MRIGWIGLGAMGLGMARRAACAGHTVIGHTRGREAHKALLTDGGSLSSDLTTVVTDADVVCINVFNDEQVRSVLYDDGVLASLPAGSTLIVHTTSSPALARQLQDDAPTGVSVVDAAFSGSPQQAAAGELTMMVGGTEASFAHVEPLLKTYASYVRHVGPVGAGMQLKLLNNLLFAAQVRLAAQAYRIGANEGIPTDIMLEVLARSSGASRALEIVGARGTVETNMERMRVYLDKDVATAMAAAAASGCDLGILGTTANGTQV